MAVTAGRNVNQFSGPPPAMEASPSKGIFSRCLEEWYARGSPTPKASGRESPSAASVEQNYSAVDEGLQLPAADDAGSNASSAAFAAGTDERASSQSSGGRARSEELDSSSVRGKRAASASAAADACNVAGVERDSNRHC